jgi:hypothetical protein
MDKIRPGVVHRNHHRGCAGVVGDRDARGSVEGCANSTVTCARTSSLGYFQADSNYIKEF